MCLKDLDFEILFIWFVRSFVSIFQLMDHLLISNGQSSKPLQCPSAYHPLFSTDVIPDIVTVGKPMGNGHPVAALVTTQKIADLHQSVASSYFCTVRKC